MGEGELRALANMAWDAICSKPDIAEGMRVQAPIMEGAKYDSEVAPQRSRNLEVLKYLDTAIDLACERGHEAIARQIELSRHCLCWDQNASYTEQTVGAYLLANYAFGMLSGPEGPLRCRYPLSGIFLLGPELLYKDHKHEPREVYYILTPGSEWCLDGGEWFAVQPGDVIFHRSWRVHATRTNRAPFLAFVAWLDEGARTAIDI